ncbi:hypothetical protein [Brachybacterium kimchii]|uniref:Head decoration protein n=1 Tax=Brachybacterium kimchii TaxID=2942909 RepID=A0ABY4N7Z4_9MICO|nr:hypothetical protein [Brachybacterium kimchii]UQN30662.1 hypothetical protein M4486_04995 [Brachybacterium kimchii]
MELGFRKTQTVGGDYRWLGSSHGTSSARPITIKRSALVEGSSLVTEAADGTKLSTKHVPSGLPVKKEADGTYSPFTADDAVEGILAGFVLETQDVSDEATEVLAPLLDHGRIIAQFLPVQVAGIADADTSGLFTWGVA